MQHSSSTVSLSIALVSLLADLLLLPNHGHDLALPLPHLVGERDGGAREAQLDGEGRVEVWVRGGHWRAHPPLVLHHLLLFLGPVLLEQ